MQNGVQNNLKSFTASELRLNTGEALEEATRDVVIITRHNKPTAALLSWEAYEQLLDTFDVLTDPRLAENVRQGIAEFYEGKVKSWEECKERLGLPD